MFVRGSGRSKLERELRDRCCDSDDNIMDAAVAEDGVVMLEIDLAFRKAVTPRSDRWDNIIVLRVVGLCGVKVEWVLLKIDEDQAQFLIVFVIGWCRNAAVS